MDIIEQGHTQGKDSVLDSTPDYKIIHLKIVCKCLVTFKDLRAIDMHVTQMTPLCDKR